METQRPICLDDFEKFAYNTLDRNALDYYRSGADNQLTLKENTEAFKRLKIRPRFLRDVSKRDTTTSILGYKISFPVCVSPTAMNKMAHAHGEVAAAKAACKLGTAYTLSTLSTSRIEEFSKGLENGHLFFQLYINKDRRITLDFIKRAESNGFKAIVLTIDTPYCGKRRADYRRGLKLPNHLRLANFETEHESNRVTEAKEISGLNEYANSLFDASLTWADVAWLKKCTHLPIVVKGVLTAEDALLAVDHGVDGILVSNHGARQLDCVPATIEALPEVVQAVNGRCEVYLDGGVRTGTDVLKALALGATAVFIGRPIIYGLAYNGEDGVSQVLDILKEEFSSSMGLAGCANIKDINSNLVAHQSSYWSKL